MQIRQTIFENHASCYELTLNNQRMVVTAGFGPRILHLDIDNGRNILFVDHERKLHRQDWFIYGGHRFWVSPETEATYNPDNAPCQVNQGNDIFTVTQYDVLSKLEKSITISARNDRFHVTHTLVNRGDLLYTGALWALTCVLPEGTVFFPWGSVGDWDIKKIQYWQKWPGQISDIGSSQYVQGKDLFLIRPTGEKGKVGTGGYEGFIGVTNQNYTFIKKYARDPAGNYPDDNCAIECYTCQDFIELETLSPLYTLQPNVPYRHNEEWILCNKAVDPANGKEVRKLL